AAERGHAVAPELGAEDRAGAQEPARTGVEPRDARLQDREHGVGEALALALGDGADELLEEKRVPRRLLDDARCRRRVDLAEHLADQALAGAGGNATELDDARLRREEAGEGLVDLGARQREDEEGPLAHLAEEDLDELHGEPVTPVQILEDE